jgi:AraC-like DNA-binding protein
MAEASDKSAVARFSTAGLPAQARLAAYRNMLGRSVGNFEIEPLADQFEFSTQSLVLPGLGVAHIRSSALRIARTRETAVDATRDLVFAVMHEGSAWREQRGRQVTIEGSGAFLSSSHDPLVTQRTSGRLTNYSLLRSDLAIGDLDRAMQTAGSIDSEIMRLLIAYTDLLFIENGLASPEARRLAVSHIYDLVALAIGTTRDLAETAKARGLRAARRAELYARAGRLIALRFNDPDLRTEELAQRLAVSARLLQKVFAERGETVMARLWDERVTRAARLLSMPEARDRSITDIAFACGFNDSSHFGRVFAARKGTTPSQWRKHAGEPPLES